MESWNFRRILTYGQCESKRNVSREQLENGSKVTVRQ